MAPRTPEPEQTEAFLEHFKALPFAQQKEVFEACRDLLAESVAKRKREIEAELDELNQLAFPSNPHQGEDGKGRKVPIKYYDRQTGDTSTGVGGWRKAAWVKAKLDAGEDIESYRVGPDNPLPSHLQ